MFRYLLSPLLPLLAVACAAAADSMVTLAVQRLPTGAIELRLVNGSPSPIVVDRQLQLFLCVTAVGEHNTAIPMPETGRVAGWSDADRSTRLVMLPPGGAVERRIEPGKGFANFRSVASVPDGKSFAYEAEVAVPAAAERLLFEYGGGRFEAEAKAFTGLDPATFAAIFKGRLTCSLALADDGTGQPGR